jgi:hypothetical protein
VVAPEAEEAEVQEAPEVAELQVEEIITVAL